MTDEDFLKQLSDMRSHLYGRDDSLLQRKRTYADCDAIRKGMESSQFRVDLKGYRFECLFHHQEGENLYVIYDGLRRDNLPGFPRWGYHRLFSGSMLCIEDPMYYLYPGIAISWYYGTKELSLIELSLEIVRAVCNHEGIKEENVIFFSSSGGGYAGIYAASLMENTLAIALNPRIYIQNAKYQEPLEHFKAMGIDLHAKDRLQRNDIPARIRGSSSKFVLLFNVQSEDDWRENLHPFLQVMGINPTYGVSCEDNVLLWIYEAVGNPKPHTSFETKSIFLFIDRIAKKFYHGRLDESDFQDVFTVNECWKEIYDLRKNVSRLKEQVRKILWLGGGDMKMPGLYSLHSVRLKPREVNFNFYRYNLAECSTDYIVHLDKVECSMAEFTVGIYDFEQKRMLHMEKCRPGERSCFHFMTGPDAREVAFLVYAGVSGQTKGQYVSVDEFAVYHGKPSAPAENIYDRVCRSLGQLGWSAGTSPEDYNRSLLPWEELVELQDLLELHRPQNILEMGLGETSKLIALYARSTGARHVVIDDDREWCQKYLTKNSRFFLETKVHISPLMSVTKNGYKCCVFRDFQKIAEAECYDAIIIHCPRGGGKMPPHADVEGMWPELLADYGFMLMEHGERSEERSLLSQCATLLAKDKRAVARKFVPLAGGEIGILTSERG